MSKTTLATAADTAAVADAPRKVPQVDPNRVTVDVSGFARKSLVVRLPPDTIADDLKEPGMWFRVQKSADKSLRQHDAVYLIAFDQTWVAEAIVSEADASGATLAGIRIVQTPQRARLLLRDCNYAVAWDGAGYYVQRIADGHRMSGSVATEQVAERDLRRLYAQPVGHR